MTSDRPYRAAQSISSGRREIERNAGKQFDPEIVRIFLGVPERIWTELRSEIENQSTNRRYEARIGRRQLTLIGRVLFSYWRGIADRPNILEDFL